MATTDDTGAETAFMRAPIDSEKNPAAAAVAASSEHPTRDPFEYDPANEEEVADYGELDYDYTSVEEKIKAGTSAKEVGNTLYRRGEYEAAWKQYDRAFVHIYTSKEEWEAIGPDWRNAINRFKLPCHLNRGLCRMKRDDLENALWDFGEALRIDSDNVKGRYRHALVLTKMVEADLAREHAGETWSLERAQNRADEAKTDLMKAVKISPNDTGIRGAIDSLKKVRATLREHQRRYEAAQKNLYTGLIHNLDRDNQRRAEEEERTIFKDMPPLERVRIA